jgi:hypothetical protein
MALSISLNSNLEAIHNQGNGFTFHRGFSDPKSRKKFLYEYPTIHFTVPILKECDKEYGKALAKNPLLDGFDIRVDRGGIGWLNESGLRLEESHTTSWEKAQFFGWLLREWKLRKSIRMT